MRHQLFISAHYVIDGMHFPNAHSVFNHAKSLGYAGGITTIESRLKSGVNTWKHLIRAPHHRGPKQLGKPKKKDPDVERAIAALDARKKEIGP